MRMSPDWTWGVVGPTMSGTVPPLTWLIVLDQEKRARKLRGVEQRLITIVQSHIFRG